jgi:hypothetical protein
MFNGIQETLNLNRSMPLEVSSDFLGFISAKYYAVIFLGYKILHFCLPFCCFMGASAIQKLFWTRNVCRSTTETIKRSFGRLHVFDD